MPRITDNAICIRHIDWSETSQIVAVLTEAHGKVRGVARGSKRLSPSSIARFSGGIELLTGGQIVAIIRPSSELANIVEWDLQAPMRHLRTDLRAQQLGLYAADVTNALLADHDPHPAAYAALRQFLLDLSDPARRSTALLRFQWDLLTDTGFRPVLDRDVRTGGPLERRPTYTFDAVQGGLTHDSGGEASAAWRVRHETVEALRNLSGPDSAMDRASALLCTYIRHIVERELPTMEFVLRPAT